MCGRARCTLAPAQVARACGFSPASHGRRSGAAAVDGGHPGASGSVPTIQADRYRPSYNVSPGMYMPVAAIRKKKAESDRKSAAPGMITENNEQDVSGPVIHCMKWGLIPSFTKKSEKPDHFRMFNARSESVKEKASFRRLLPANRCLVAVEGFYEWKKDGSKKQPYYIHFMDQRPLVFAALYDSWVNEEAEKLYTFTILTTRVSTALEWLHDRMPVILGDQQSIDAWLTGDSRSIESLTVPYEHPDLVWYPVTTAVGKTSFNGPECIKEVKTTSEKTISSFFAKKQCDAEHPVALEKSPKENAPDSCLISPLKDEVSADEDVKGTPANASIHIKTEPSTVSSNKAGAPPTSCIKREFEEPMLQETEVRKSDSLPISPVKKRARGAKNAGDGQASLLSYFGKK